MEFITAEKATELGLSEDQIKGIAPLYNDDIAAKKLEWDGVANKNAEGIINGALAKVAVTTKVARMDGEKAAEYITRASSEYLTTQKTEVSQLKADYDLKLKEFNGGDATKAELLKVKEDYDKALEKLADYDTLKETAEKFDPLQKEYLDLKETVTFQSVKPPVPDTVNKYEFVAKWIEFTTGVKDKYNVEYVDNIAIAIDKENHHKQVKLADLLSQDKNLTDLLAGRQQRGPNGKVDEEQKLDGIPFALPTNPSSEAISKAINEHLDKQGVSKTAKERTKAFMEMNSKVREALTKK